MCHCRPILPIIHVSFLQSFTFVCLCLPPPSALLCLSPHYQRLIPSSPPPHLLYFSLQFLTQHHLPLSNKPVLQSLLSFSLFFPVPHSSLLFTFLYQSLSLSQVLPLTVVQSLSSTINLYPCLHLWCAHSGWRQPTQSSQGAEGLSTPTQALRHGTQRNRDRGERTDGRRTHWLPVL